MFKNENGFSLVELAIAAGLAVALAATAVTILSGTTATLSSKANGAAGTSSQYNTDVLNETGATSGTSNNNGGSNNSSAPTFASAVGSATIPSWLGMMGGYGMSWTESSPLLQVGYDTPPAGNSDTPQSYQYASNSFAGQGLLTQADIVASSNAQWVYAAPDAYTIVATNYQDPSNPRIMKLYKMNAAGEIIAW